MKATRQDLLAEIDELRLRLQEAEETLEALRTGAVDALVVSSDEGEQVYTLQGADQTYRHLVENINEGAGVLTMAGDILYANRRLAELLGLPLERLIGSNLREHITETDLVYFSALLATAQKGESQGEVLLQTDRGDSLAVYLSFKVLNLDKAAKSLSLLVTDLTEQKRQEAIITEGKLIQEILQQGELSIAVCDRSGRIIRASKGLQALAGQNPLLLPFHLVFPLKLSSGKTFLLAPLFQGQTLHNIEANFQRPDGREIHVVFNAGPLRAKDSEIIGFVANLTDISERKKAETEREKLLARLQVNEEELQTANEELQVHVEELRVQAGELQSAYQELHETNKALEESRQDLKRAQAMAHVGSWRLKMQRHTLSCCDETYRIFGIAFESSLSFETFRAAVHPEDREFVDRKWQAALEGEPYDIEHRITVDGAIKWVRELAELEFDSQGHFLGAFGTVQDITARKQIEEALRQSNQRLDLLAETASRLLASSDPQEVLDSICRKVMVFLDCDVFFSYLREEPEGRLHLQAWAGIPDQEAQRLEWLDEGAAGCGCAAGGNCPMVAEDMQNIPDLRPEPVKSLRHPGLCLPAAAVAATSSWAPCPTAPAKRRISTRTNWH